MLSDNDPMRNACDNVRDRVGVGWWWSEMGHVFEENCEECFLSVRCSCSWCCYVLCVLFLQRGRTEMVKWEREANLLVLQFENERGRRALLLLIHPTSSQNNPHPISQNLGGIFETFLYNPMEDILQSVGFFIENAFMNFCLFRIIKTTKISSEQFLKRNL